MKQKIKYKVFKKIINIFQCLLHKYEKIKYEITALTGWPKINNDIIFTTPKFKKEIVAQGVSKRFEKPNQY